MRFSIYNILSDRLPGGGYVLLNGLSGAIDLVDKEIYDGIKNNRSIEDIGMSAEDIAGFRKRGFLTEESEAEEIESAKSWIRAVRETPVPYSVVIAPNMTCNYRCVYCFEKGNKYYRGECSANMTHEDVDGVFRFIEKHEVKRSITLFGGEPLDKNHLEIIDYIVNEKNRDGQYAFDAITNGHDLNDFLPYLGEGKIEKLQITIDGPKQIHDKRRIALDKTSSFDRIMANLQPLIGRTDVEIRLRINVDLENLPHLAELMQIFTAAGIMDAENFTVYTSKVSGGAISEDDERCMDVALTELGKVAPKCEVHTEEDRIRDTLQYALQSGEPVSRSVTFCGALGRMLVFTPEHNVYSCWEYLGMNQNVIGRYTMDGEILWNEAELAHIQQLQLENHPICIQCPYVLLCSGGCFKQMLDAGLGYDYRRCVVYKRRFIPIMEQVVEAWIQEEIEAEENT